ncbi:MAG: TIGR04282 family arsenosugar biosynthesis glycosyltransferase [Myxococcota bacterium]|nr:TIGR04282 family arsenosugar biosynthesis glycosyltransferase [Myxococcota bacterium]
MSCAIVMLTKCPSEMPKSRLAQAIGASKAIEVHVSLVLHMAEIIKASRLPFWVSFKGPIQSQLAKQLRKLGAQVTPQSEGGLGDRIYHAFSLAERCTVVGSDCPWISIEQLQEASKTKEVVIGPAFDGGYYLISASRPPKALFEDISWSTDEVLAQTLQKCRSLSIPVIQQEVRYDIDTIHDLHRAIRSNHLPPNIHERFKEYARSL